MKRCKCGSETFVRGDLEVVYYRLDGDGEYIQPPDYENETIKEGHYRLECEECETIFAKWDHIPDAPDDKETP